MRVRERADGEIGQLWSNIFLAGGQAAPRVIVVTGARRGDGATQIACALGLFGAAANEELRVALVDGNLRGPGVARAMGLPDSPGLSDVLSGAATVESAMQGASLDNGHCLYVMAAGSRIARPLSLLRSRQVKGIVGRLRDRYDHVIIDAADATSHPDAQILGALCDGALLVVRAGKTPRETAGEIKKRLDLAGVRCLGLVLNQRTDPIPDLVYQRT